MARVEGWIAVEMASVQRLRIHPPLSVGQFDQGHGDIGAQEFRIGRGGHLDTDVGAAAEFQQRHALVTHHVRSAHHVAQAALVQDDDVGRTAVGQEALLPTQPGPDPLLQVISLGDTGEQRPGYVSVCNNPGTSRS